MSGSRYNLRPRSARVEKPQIIPEKLPPFTGEESEEEWQQRLAWYNREIALNKKLLAATRREMKRAITNFIYSDSGYKSAAEKDQAVKHLMRLVGSKQSSHESKTTATGAKRKRARR